MERGLSIPFRDYEDFQPLSSFIHDDNSDTLSLTLPGYRKEQIKVQIDSFGTLKITGERSLGVGNKWSRFRKDFRTPANCKTGEIRAKFENEVLNIIMPKTTGQPPKPAGNVTSTSRLSDQVAPPTSANPTPKTTTTTTPSHDHNKPTTTVSPKLPPPPMVAPPSHKPATEARVSPNKPVVPPSQKPAHEPNFSPMKPVAPPNQKPVAEPIVPTPKPQVPPQMMSAGSHSNAEALLPRKNPAAHDYENRKTTETEHHHNPEEKKNWTSSSSASGSSSSNNTSTDDDSDDEHKHGHEHEHHEHAGKGKKKDEIENCVHGGDSAVVGKLKKKKDELMQKMSDYRRQSGGATGGGMNMTSMMENYKHKFEGIMKEMKKKTNSSTTDGEINRTDLVVNMAVAGLVVVALGVYVTWSFKSIHLE